MTRARASMVAFAVTVLLLVGCGSEDSSAPAPTTGTPQTSGASGAQESAPSTSSTPPTAPTTTAPPPPTLYFPEPAGAADHLVNAWKAGNRDEALLGALPKAVNDIFAVSEPENFFLYSCDSGEFATSICNYRNRPTNGYVQVTAEKQAQGWLVTGVFAATDG